jgi:hypothetical protein
VEKQVYETHSVVNILTNKRCLKLLQARPIDQLVALLKGYITSSNPKLDDFEDFCTKYPTEEVLNMLVQIISDGNEGKYLVSQKLDQAIF